LSGLERLGGGKSSIWSKCSGFKGSEIRCPSSNHWPRSTNLQRSEQKGAGSPANQSPLRRQVGHFTRDGVHNRLNTVRRVTATTVQPVPAALKPVAPVKVPDYKWIHLFAHYCRLFGWLCMILAISALVAAGYFGIKNAIFFQKVADKFPEMMQTMQPGDLIKIAQSLLPQGWHLVLRTAEGQEIAKVLANAGVRQAVLELNERLAKLIRDEAQTVADSAAGKAVAAAVNPQGTPEQMANRAWIRQQIIRDTSWVAASLLAVPLVIWAIKLEIAAYFLLMSYSLLLAFRDLCRNSFHFRSGTESPQ
jgi:hypothetical protein